MANIKSRRPLSPSVPGEYTRAKGVHFPTQQTSSAVAQAVPPTFANTQQTVVGFETVTLNFTIGNMLTGSSAMISSSAPAFFQTLGRANLSPTDTGKIIASPGPTPLVTNAVVAGPVLTLSARGGSISADGTLTPGAAYSQIKVTGSIQVAALGLVNPRTISVPVTAQLVGSSVT